MKKTKAVTISLTPSQQEKAKEQSKNIFGRPNISGYIAYLIEKNDKKG